MEDTAAAVGTQAETGTCCQCLYDAGQSEAELLSLLLVRATGRGLELVLCLLAQRLGGVLGGLCLGPGSNSALLDLSSREVFESGNIAAISEQGKEKEGGRVCQKGRPGAWRAQIVSRLTWMLMRVPTDWPMSCSEGKRVSSRKFAVLVRKCPGLTWTYSEERHCARKRRSVRPHGE